MTDRSYPGLDAVRSLCQVQVRWKSLELGISAYNLFNSFALQGAGGVIDATHIGAGGAQGRSIKGSIKLSF